MKTIKHDAYDVKMALKERVEDVAMALFPQGKRQSGCWRVGGIDGERGRSLSIPLEGPAVGSFTDFADPDNHGTLIDLWMAVHGIGSFAEAVDDAGDWLQLVPNKSHERNDKQPRKWSKPKDDELGVELTDKSEAAAYLDGRNIPLKVAQAAGVRQSPDGRSLVFVEFRGSEPVLAKFWHTPIKEKELGTKHQSSKNPKHVLIGVNTLPLDLSGEVTICEGQMDMLSYRSVGVPCVSVPNGASNEIWIEEEWEWLRQFHTINLSLDNDEAGKKATESVTNRLGRERVRVVRLPMKDANDMLQAGRRDELVDAHAAADYMDPDELVAAQAFKEEVRELCQLDVTKWGLPFIFQSFPLRFRRHETTVWTGYTGHGKSTAVEDLCCLYARMGIMSCIASLETRSQMTLRKMMMKWTADGDIGRKSDKYDRAFDALAPNIIMYHYTEKCPPKAIIKRFEYAHKRWGVKNFVLDNAMMLKIDRQDNEAQAQASDMFKEFVKKLPVHLHIVVHPRKPPVGEAPKPPSLHEVRGASEWCDMAHNVVAVWRNMAKPRALEQLKYEDADLEQIQEMMMMPDGMFCCGKQRMTGDTPEARFWFDKESMRFKNNYYEETQPYWTDENADKDKGDEGGDCFLDDDAGPDGDGTEATVSKPA